MLTTKYISKILVLLTAVLLVLLAGESAHGAQTIDFDRDISLTVSYQNEAVPVAGAAFSVYQIAAVDEYGQPVVSQAFSGYNVPLTSGENLVQTQMRGAATALEGYVLRDSLTPVDTGTTGSDGMVRFPQNQESIEPGVYLLLGQRHTQDGLTYDADPIVLTLPARDEATGQWEYDVVVNVKFRTTVTPSQGTTTVRKVLKVWNDAGYEWLRPQEITVQLLCDGQIYDTVVLHEDNEWRYTWYGLDGNHQWNVVEVSSGLGRYTLSVIQEGITFVVTNTYQPKSPSSDGTYEPPGETIPPDVPTEEVGTPSDENLEIQDSDIPSTEFPTLIEEPKKEKLPQTGQLWWPVGALAAVGLLFIVMGLIRRKGDPYER